MGELQKIKNLIPKLRVLNIENVITKLMKIQKG